MEPLFGSDEEVVQADVAAATARSEGEPVPISPCSIGCSLLPNGSPELATRLIELETTEAAYVQPDQRPSALRPRPDRPSSSPRKISRSTLTC